MATNSSYQGISLTFNQIIMAFAVIMVAAGAFVAIITNVVVSSRVGALEATLAAQYNPVNVTAAEQTNNPPLTCVDPNGGVVNGAYTDSEGNVLGTSTAGVLGYGTAKTKYLPLLGSHSQSNSSVITTTSTNYYTDNRWSGNSNTQSWSWSDSSTNGSYNSNTQTWNSSNTQAWNNGNTTNTDNSNHQSSTTTNTSVNTSVTVTDNGNTSNSNNSNTQTWHQDNNSTNNSGNTTSATTNTTNDNSNQNNNSSSNVNNQNNGNNNGSGNTVNNDNDGIDLQ